MLTIKCTEEAAERIKGLAYYLGTSYAEMLRQLAEEKRAQLVESGKRPPLRPPPEHEFSESQGSPPERTVSLQRPGRALSRIRAPTRQ